MHHHALLRTATLRCLHESESESHPDRFADRRRIDSGRTQALELHRGFLPDCHRTGRTLRHRHLAPAVAYESPNSSATGCSCSTCCDTTLTMTRIGTLRSMPQTPHSQPQNISEMNTAAEFRFAMRPVIQVVTKVPITVAMASDAPATSNAIAGESNWMYAAV